MVDRNSPEFLSHYFRVLAREARSRRQAHRFHVTLINWMGNARRRYAAAAARERAKPTQLDLFGAQQ